MRNVTAFLRSMTCGLILMGLVIVCSLCGSFLPQGQPAAWYLQQYPQVGPMLLALRLDDIFAAWYFVALLALLCLNLTLCSILRFRGVRGAHRALLQEAQATAPVQAVTPGQLQALRAHLERGRYQQADAGEHRVYFKHAVGHYGSFLVHLSFLLTLAVGAMVMYASEVSDHSVLPGGALALADGTQLVVDDFRITDDTGRLDFTSTIHVNAAGGATAPVEISVNHPYTYGAYKFYQQTYGTAGSVTATNLQTGGSDVFMLTEAAFLSADGRNGMFYEALHPGYTQDADGHFTLITSTSGVYVDPVYQVVTHSDGVATPVLAFPGDTIRVHDLQFTFQDPVAYPGIRVKHTPRVLLGLLYAVFALMIWGFWLCFFQAPVYIVVGEGGYALLGPKQTGTQLELEVLLKETGGEPC